MRARAVRRGNRSGHGCRARLAVTVPDTVAEDDRVAVRITWSGTYNASHFRAGAPIPEPAAVPAVVLWMCGPGRS